MTVAFQLTSSAFQKNGLKPFSETGDLTGTFGLLTSAVKF